MLSSVNICFVMCNLPGSVWSVGRFGGYALLCHANDDGSVSAGDIFSVASIDLTGITLMIRPAKYLFHFS